MSRELIEGNMRNYPPQEQILTMEPEDLGRHMLQHMLRGGDTHRFNFMQMVWPGQVSERFMEAWGWLEREGFIAHRPNDMNGQSFFVTRAGQRVAATTNTDAWKNESMFPDGLDPIVMASVRFSSAAITIRPSFGLSKKSKSVSATRIRAWPASPAST